MDNDARRILNTFAREIGMLADGAAPSSLIERTQTALHAALTSAAGRPEAEHWRRLHREARRLVACLDETTALPGLRAFLAENADLRDEGAELVRS